MKSGLAFLNVGWVGLVGSRGIRDSFDSYTNAVEFPPLTTLSGGTGFSTVGAIIGSYLQGGPRETLEPYTTATSIPADTLIYGIGFASNGVINMAANKMAGVEDFQGYSNGSNPTLNGGTGWATNGAIH